MAVGDIGVWRDNVGGQLPGSTFGAFQYPLEVRNDGEYTYLSGAIRVQSAGTYLIMWGIVTANATNDRLNYEAGVQRNGAFENTGNNGFDAGYSRNTSNQWAGARNMCVKALSALDTFQVSWRRGTAVGTGGSQPDYSELIVIRLPDATPYAFLGSFPANQFNGLTWQNLGFYSQQAGNAPASISYDSGTSELVLHGSERLYLVGYAVVGATGDPAANNRTQRIGRVTADGIEIPHSFDHTYQRNSVNPRACVSTTFLFRSKNGGGDRLLAQCQRGNAAIDGTYNAQPSWSGMWAIELPETVEAYLAADATGAQSLNNASTSLNWSRAASVTSPSFSRVSNVIAQVDKACDAIIIGNGIGNRTNLTATPRNVRATVVYINAAAQLASAGFGYLRGDFAGVYTCQLGMYTHHFASVTVGQQVDLRSLAFGENGEATDATEANRLGMAMINVDTLFTPPGVSGAGTGIVGAVDGDGTGSQGFTGAGTGSVAGPEGEGAATTPGSHEGAGTGVQGGQIGDGVGSQGFTGAGTGLQGGPLGAGAGSQAFTGAGTGIQGGPIGDGTGVNLSRGGLYLETSREVRGHWIDLVETPQGYGEVRYDNDRRDPPDPRTQWMQLRVLHEGAEFAGAGRTRCYTHTGILRLTVFQPLVRGDLTAVDPIDATLAALESRTIGGIIYGEGEVENLGRSTGLGGGRHVVRLELPFETQRLELPLANHRAPYALTDAREFQTVIRDRFGIEIEDALPILTIYDNDADADAKLADVRGEFIRHQIQQFPESEREESGPSGTYSHSGIAQASVFTPTAELGGDTRSLDICDEIILRHRDVADRGVHFGTAYVESVGREGPWWRSDVFMPFETRSRNV